MVRCNRTEGRETDRGLETVAVSERVTGSVGDVIRARSGSSRVSLVVGQPVDRMGAETVGEWMIAAGQLGDTRATMHNHDLAIATLTGTGIGGAGRRMPTRKLALAVQLRKVEQCHQES